MKAKLTLSLDKDLVKFAHAEARREQRSVSGMVSDFLTDRKAHQMRQQVPSAAEMVGTLKKYAIDDSKAGIQEAYAEKYLR